MQSSRLKKQKLETIPEEPQVIDNEDTTPIPGFLSGDSKKAEKAKPKITKPPYMEFFYHTIYGKGFSVQHGTRQERRKQLKLQEIQEPSRYELAETKSQLFMKKKKETEKTIPQVVMLQQNIQINVAPPTPTSTAVAQPEQKNVSQEKPVDEGSTCCFCFKF